MMTITYGLVLAGVVCLYLQLILGYICRWSTNWFPQVVALAANNLSSVINTIALGSMAKEHNAGVWILHLVVLNNSLVTQDPEHVMHHVLSLVNIGVIGCRAFRIVGHTGLQGVTCFVAKLFTIALVCVFALSKFLLGKGTSSKGASQEVADHMKKEHLHHGKCCASTLEGYRYLVSSTTTVEDIYSRDYGELAQGKDICLSFALFRLLFRRCQGFRCHEARVPKTAAFVLGNLLPPAGTDDRYERGFAVVEMELAFLHDHIHGGHVLWSPAHYFCYIALVVMNTLFMYTGSVLLSFTRREEHNMHVYMGNSISLLASKVVFDLLLVILHCNSNRWLVSHMCRCRPEDQTLYSRFDRFIAYLNMNKVLHGNYYWQNRIGQYTLLDEPGSTLREKIIDGTLSKFSGRNGSHRPRVSPPALLPSNLKTRISQVLRDSNGGMDLDGVPCLETDMRLPLEHSWQNERVVDKIKVIFMWHITTSYCELQQPPPEGYEVATTLSRYCAYLLAFRPELLPGRTMDTKRIFRKVLAAVRTIRESEGTPWVLPDLINRLNDWLERYMVIATTEYEREYELISQEIIANMTPDDGCVILTDGLNLGWHLMNCVISNNTERWRILENIWVKLVLSIAIQDREHPNYAKPHEDCLAEGGEFLTHLWALLSHAGITEQQAWPPQQVYDHGQTEEFIQNLQDNYL